MRNDEMDEATVALLVGDLHDALEEHYKRSRGGQISVYEALSGLAIMSAATLDATKMHKDAVTHFTEALRLNLSEMLEGMGYTPKPN